MCCIEHAWNCMSILICFYLSNRSELLYFENSCSVDMYVETDPSLLQNLLIKLLYRWSNIFLLTGKIRLNQQCVSWFIKQHALFVDEIYSLFLMQKFNFLFLFCNGGGRRLPADVSIVTPERDIILLQKKKNSSKEW